MRSVLALALLTGSSMVPALATAQAATAATTDTAASNLDDIVVTARRRAENLQDVPLSVTAFSPATLAADRIVDRTDLANFTPSLITITGGYPKEFAFFALRGQGPAFGSVPGVINYFAEVPALVGIDGRTGSYYDLANIQVLAGPQGTLFGKNATGGNILFEPQRPTNKFEGYAQAELGNLKDRRFEGAINIPIVDDKILLRVAGELGRRDGYTIDVGPNFAGKDYDNLHYESVRASLTIRPFDGVELYTVGRYYGSSSNGPGTVLKQFDTNLGAGLLPVLAVYPGVADAVAAQAALGNRRVGLDIDQFSKTKYWQLINHATVELSDTLTLKNIISYSKLTYRYGYDYDATPFPLFGQTSRSGYPTQAPTYFTEELQLQGKAFDNALNFVVGGYYDRSGLHSHQGAFFTQYPTSAFLGAIPIYTDNKSRSHAVFGQGTLDFTSLGLAGLSITGGLRHTWDRVFTETQIIAPPAISGTGKFQYTSYNATLDYALSSRAHVYVTSRDAYKAGGVNGPVPVGSAFRTFPPERLQDLEVGLKAQFDIGGVAGRFNVAAYRGDYTNIQRSTVELVSGTLVNVTRSAAKGRIQGLEITTAIVPAEGLTLNASYSLTDSKYTKAIDASAGAILAGAAFPFTPHDKVTLGASFERPAGNLGTVALSVNWAYQTRFSTAQTNQALVRYLPGYGTVSLRAGLRDIAGRPIDLSVFMANAADNEYATGLLDGGALGIATYTYSEPRTYGVQLRFRFGS